MTEPNILTRSYPAELEIAGDGRTIEGRAVPYDETAEVEDAGVRYRERFEAGSFRRATRAPFRLVLLYEHRDGLGDIVGPGVSLEEKPDGLYGSWRAVQTRSGDEALGLIREGVLRGLSVGFRPLGPGRRDEDGTVVRTNCALDEVSLTRTPAFESALVTSVRSAPQAWNLPEELRPHELDPELEERLRALGLRGE